MKKQLCILMFGISLGSLLQAQSTQIRVHDPVAIKAEGKYYMFSTGRGVASWSSEDKIHWQYLSRVFDSIPEWCKKEVPKFDGNIWAPDIMFFDGLYYLYYSISSFASNRSAIGVVTNVSLDPDNPDFQWEDHGIVVESVPGRDHFNAIDPNLCFDENGIPWLSFGSFWGGIKLVRLADDLLSVAKPEEWETIATRERSGGLDATDPGNGAIEAPFIIHRGDYYYLFVSFDLCCRGSRSTYNVRVGRSDMIRGPYIDKDGMSMENGGGTLVVKGDDDYYGIGHNSIYQFDEEYIMFSHGYDVHDRGKSKLVIHKVLWDEDHWPYLELLD